MCLCGAHKDPGIKRCCLIRPEPQPEAQAPDKEKTRGFKVAQRIEQEANELRRITETLFLQGNIGPVEYHSICKKTDLIQEGAGIIQGEMKPRQ